MRDFKGMKRQRGRNRKPGGGGGGGGGQNPNRAFESNGPDGVKIRGASQHVYERYHQLARDAFASGDRVLAENYLQHAEHYFRVLRTLQPQRPVAEIAARDAFASGFDIDFEDESGAEAEAEGGAPEAVEEGGEAQPYVREGREGGEFRRDRDRDREFRGERRDGEHRREGGEQRREGGEQRREGGEQRREGGEQRAEGEGGFREGGGRRESRRERFERRREERRARGEGHPAEAGAGDPMPVVEPQSAPLPAAAEGEASPMLRAQDGAESQMPAFLRQAVPAAAAAPSPEGETAAEPVERPKRTRRRRPESFEAAEGEAPVAPAEEQA
jgi:hypothetical protein